MRIALIVLALAVILCFLLTPWVAITPTDFLPDTIQQVLDIADAGLRRLAPAPIPGLLDLLESVTSLTPFRMLTTGYLNSWMWIAILMPLAAAGITLLLVLPGCAFDSEPLVRWGSFAATCGGGLAAAVLIISLPVIEHLGLGGAYLARLGLALAGLHLAWGYWLTLAAVVGLTVVGVLCLVDQPRTSRGKLSPPAYGRGTSIHRR